MTPLSSPFITFYTHTKKQYNKCCFVEYVYGIESFERCMSKVSSAYIIYALSSPAPGNRQSCGSGGCIRRNPHDTGWCRCGKQRNTDAGLNLCPFYMFVGGDTHAGTTADCLNGKTLAVYGKAATQRFQKITQVLVKGDSRFLIQHKN